MVEMSLRVDHMPDLGITRLSRWCFNCYLIEGDTGLFVVDAGMPRIADDLEPLIHQRGTALTVVTATHGHPDHIGGTSLLARRHNAQVLFPAITLTYLADAQPRTPTVAKLLRTWPLLFGQPFDHRAALGFVQASSTAGFGTPRGMLWPGPTPAPGLHDGMTLPGAAAWTVMATPGHTDDHIALWNSESRSLLSGDAVIAVRGRPRFAPDTVDDMAAADTRRRLIELPVEHLLPGHGLPVHGRPLWRNIIG
jgi:glyoxylase-like metal-dependent hydrolase (beta-lactamase superfamily II)